MNPVLSALEERLADPRLRGIHGRFHTHLTVVDAPGLADACARLGVRRTVVDLADFAARAQRDVMVTVDHHEIGPDALARVAERLREVVAGLEGEGIRVLRLKIEHGSLPTVAAFDQRVYREAHLKLAIPAAEHPSVMERLRASREVWGYAPSRNPREQRGDTVIQFVNLRCYGGDVATTDARIDALAAWLGDQGLPPIEVRRETAIVDTAREQDAWWG